MVDHPVVSWSQAAPGQLAGKVDDVIVVRCQNLRKLNVMFCSDELPPFIGSVKWNVRSEKTDRHEEWFISRLGQFFDSPRRDTVVALIFVACRELSPIP